MPSRRGLLRLFALSVGTLAGCSADESSDDQTTVRTTKKTVTTTRISTPKATSAVTTTPEATAATSTSDEAASEPSDANGTVAETPPTTTALPSETNATTTATTTAAPSEQSGGPVGGGGGSGGGGGGGSGGGGGGGGGSTGSDDGGSTDGDSTDDSSTSEGDSVESTPTDKPLPDPVRSYPHDARLTVAAGDYELVGFEVTSKQVFTFVITSDDDRDFDLYGATAEQVGAYEDQLFSDGGSFEVVDNLTERDSNGEAWSVNEPVTGTYYFIIDNTQIGTATTATESLSVNVWLRTDPYGDKI